MVKSKLKVWGSDHKLNYSLENWKIRHRKYYDHAKVMEDKMAKILKIKVGEFYDGKENKPVFLTAWEQTSKKGDKFYSVNLPIFVNEIKDKGA